MLRRSEDIFLDELDVVVSSVIKDALNEIDKSSCDKAMELLKPFVDKKDKAAIFYSSSFGVPGEQLEEFEERRIKQLQQSAELGYAPAIHELAVHYDSGELVQRDIEQAAQLFKQAAEKGHPHSQWIHGLDLLYGRNGITKDEKLGLRYIQESAAVKFEGALETLAEFYEKGLFGFRQDLVRAQQLLKQIENGDVISY